MGVEYVSVQWNRQKKFYDAVLIGGVAAYLAIFGVLTKILFPHVTDEIMLMRAFGFWCWGIRSIVRKKEFSCDT